MLVLTTTGALGGQLLSNADFSKWSGRKPSKWSTLGRGRVVKSTESYDSAIAKNPCAVVTCRKTGDGLKQALTLEGPNR